MMIPLHFAQISQADYKNGPGLKPLPSPGSFVLSRIAPIMFQNTKQPCTRRNLEHPQAPTNQKKTRPTALTKRFVAPLIQIFTSFFSLSAAVSDQRIPLFTEIFPKRVGFFGNAVIQHRVVIFKKYFYFIMR